MYNTEENAKTLIDKQLERSGWDLIKDIEKELTISTEPIQRADYLLKGENTEFVALIEAKKKGVNLDSAIEQAKLYAETTGVKYIFASDGEQIKFVNLFTGKRKDLERFYSKEELLGFLNQEDPDRNIYKGLPENLRYYQREAIQAVINVMDVKTLKAFLEMATGTGKTYTTATLIEELIHIKKVNRVLFLVDRENLAEQSLNSFQKTFQGRVPVSLVKGNANDKNNKVLVSTVQKMYSDGWNKEQGEYSPLMDRDFFDLIILDECHRSYFGSWHIILDYFNKAVKLGLTATPAKLKDRNTFDYFGEPIYRYTYLQGVEDKYLCPSEIHTIRTNIDIDGLSYDGKDFHQRDLEIKVNVPNRNKLIVQKYRENFPTAKKTIVFAVSQKHASQLADLFRQEYGEDTVCIIVSDQNGNTNSDLIARFRDPDSRLKIACTVDMLATGFDAPSVEVLVMARPTKSKILYYQMKGRGSRLYKDSKTGYEKSVFHILDFVDNVTHEYESKIIKGEEIEKEESEENNKHRSRSSPPQTREDVDRQGKTFVIAEGVEVWVEQEEFLTENEQKLKEILSSVGEQIIKKEAEKKEFEKFKQAIVSWEYFNPDLLPTEDYINKMGIDLEDIRNHFNLPTADLQKLVDLVMERKKDNTLKAKREQIFTKWLRDKGYEEQKKKFLTLCFNSLQNGVVADVQQIWTLGMISAFGGISNVVNMFGGKDEASKAVVELKQLIEFAKYL